MIAPLPEPASTPSLRGRISRALVWLGAMLAVASFVLAEPLGSRFGTAAIGCAILALLVWRGWRPPAGVDAPPTALLDDTSLAETLARIHRVCAPNQPLDDALRGVVRTLAQELGARNARASRVGGGVGRAQLTTLLDLAAPGVRRPPARPAKNSLPAGPGPLERALDGAGVVSDARGHAFAVSGRGGVVAVIDFDALELEVAPAALQRLLEGARQALGALAAQPEGAATLAVLTRGADDVGFLASINANRDVGVFVLEPQHLRLMGVSRRAERDFGVRRQRVVGKTVAQAFGAPIEQRLGVALRNALAGEQAVELTLTWPSRRGQRGAHLNLCVVRRADAAPRWLIGMARALQPESAFGAERRAMPRHGLLVDDVAPRASAALGRPTVASDRRGDES